MKDEIQKEYAVVQAQFIKGMISIFDKYGKDYVMILRNGAGQSCNIDLRLEVETIEENAEAMKLARGCTGSCEKIIYAIANEK